MGRVKLEIKKIENPTNRQVTYSKRRNGLMKKAYELSVLCDIDIAVVMFSPSGKLTVFCKDDRIEEVIARYANTPQHERTKRKFENVEYLNKVVQKLSEERGLEPPRIGYAELQAENMELKTSIHKIAGEKLFYEQKARLFAGTEYINTFTNLPQLATIKSELEQALEKVRDRMTQLQAERNRQSQLQQQYEILALPPPRDGSSNLNEGSTASSADGAQSMQMHNSWGALHLDNASPMLSNSQMREPAGTDFEGPSSSFYQRRPAMQPVFNDNHLAGQCAQTTEYAYSATKVEENQFGYGGGGQGQIPSLSNQVKQGQLHSGDSEYQFYTGSLHQPQQPWSSYS